MGNVINKEYLNKFWKHTLGIPTKVKYPLDNKQQTIKEAIESKQDSLSEGFGISLADQKITAEVKYVGPEPVEKVTGVTFTPKNWVTSFHLPISNGYMSEIWTNGTDYYYSDEDKQFKLVNGEWVVTPSDEFGSFTPLYGYKIFYYEAENQTAYIDGNRNTFAVFSDGVWTSVPSSIFTIGDELMTAGCNIWTDNGGNSYYSDSPLQYKLVDEAWVALTEEEMGDFWPSMGSYVWHDLSGHTYYSEGNTQYELTAEGWVVKIWSLSTFEFERTPDTLWGFNGYGYDIKTINGHVYYINSNDNTTTYELIDGKWVKSAGSFIPEYGNCIWSDNNSNTYYSENQDSGNNFQYKLVDGAWVAMTQNEIEKLGVDNGCSVWHDKNGNTYHNYQGNQYRLTETNEWEQVATGVPSSFEYLIKVYDADGNIFVWNWGDGNNEIDYCATYDNDEWRYATEEEMKRIFVGLDYSNLTFTSFGINVGEHLYAFQWLYVGSSPEIKITHEWVDGEWFECNLFDTTDFNIKNSLYRNWTDNEGNVYISYDDDQYKINFVTETVLSSDSGKYVTNHDDELQKKIVDFYEGSTTTTYNTQLKWTKQAKGSWSNFGGLYDIAFWEDADDNIYMVYGNTYNSSAGTYKIDRDTLTLTQVDFSNDIDLNTDYNAVSNIWVDRNNNKTYYSIYNGSYVLESDGWTEMTKPDIFPQYGYNVWYFDGDTYYSNYDTHYKLNADGSWSVITWNYASNVAYKHLDGRGIWTDGTELYYVCWEDGYGTIHTHFNKNTNQWETITWNIDFWSKYGIWHYDGKTYYSGTNDEQYELINGSWVEIDWTPYGHTPENEDSTITWSNFDQSFVISVMADYYDGGFYTLGYETTSTTTVVPDKYLTIHNDILQTKLYESPSVSLSDNIVKLRAIYGGEPLTDDEAIAKVEEVYGEIDDNAKETFNEDPDSFNGTDMSLWEEVGYCEIPIFELQKKGYPNYTLNAVLSVCNSNSTYSNSYYYPQNLNGFLKIELTLSYQQWYKQYTTDTNNFICSCNPENLDNMFIVTYDNTQGRVYIYFNKVKAKLTKSDSDWSINIDHYNGYYVPNVPEGINHLEVLNAHLSKIALTSITDNSLFQQGSGVLYSPSEVINRAGMSGTNMAAYRFSTYDGVRAGSIVHTVKINGNQKSAYSTKDCVGNWGYEKFQTESVIDLGPLVEKHSLLSTSLEFSNASGYWQEIGFLANYITGHESDTFQLGYVPYCNISFTFAVNHRSYWKTDYDTSTHPLTDNIYTGFLTIDIQKSTRNGNVSKIICRVSEPSLAGMFRVVYDPNAEAADFHEQPSTSDNIFYNGCVLAGDNTPIGNGGIGDAAKNICRYIRLYSKTTEENFIWELTEINSSKSKHCYFINTYTSQTLYPETTHSSWYDEYLQLYDVTADGPSQPENGLLAVSEYTGGSDTSTLENDITALTARVAALESEISSITELLSSL